jgi:hypothetical protein
MRFALACLLIIPVAACVNIEGGKGVVFSEFAYPRTPAYRSSAVVVQEPVVERRIVRR